MDWEDYYRRKDKAEWIWLRSEGVDERLNEIMLWWYEKGHAVGDKGCCVLGQGMFFNLDGKDYWMVPATGWQGEGSWTPFVNDVIEKLEAIGATDIRWNCGHLD